MKKTRVFRADAARAIRAAIVRRFGGPAGVGVREDDGGLCRLIVDKPRAEQLHVAAEFSEREEKGEKLTGLSFSSETPVMRWGEKEVLLHDSESANFDRLLSVGAVLRNHDPDQIVGVPVKAWIDDRRRGNLAMRWGTTDTAGRAKTEALVDKTLRGVSVGYQVREWIYLRDASETYRGISGPAWVAVKWDALEASLTPVPADPSVGLGRSAATPMAPVTGNNAVPGSGAAPQQEIRAMKKLKLLRAWKAADGKDYAVGQVLEVDERTFAELTAGETPVAEAAETRQEAPPAPAPTPSAPNTDDIRAQAREVFRAELRAEAERASDIRSACKRAGMPEMADELIATGKTVAEAQRTVLDKLIERQAAIRPATGTITLVKDGADSFRAAAVDGLLLRSGTRIEKPADGSVDFRGLSLLRLAEECLRRSGRRVSANLHEMVGAALNMRGSDTIAGSTSDFPLILATTANKSLIAGYEAAAVSFPSFARVGSLNDFKAATRIKFSEVGKLKLVAEGGKYTETKRTEKRETIQLGTYARKWTMSRQAVINDDLGAFTNTMFSFGMQAKFLPNDLAIAVLNDNSAMADGFSLFSTQHANYSHETDRRLDTLAHATSALIYMIGVLGEQKSYQHADESDGARYLNLRPAVWLVSMTDSLLARQVVVSSTDAGQSNPGVANPVQGLTLAVVADQNIKTGATDYKHFLFADPRLAPVVEVAFLQGNQQPYMEEMDQSDADGRVWLVRLDCGAAAVDSVGAVLEVGTD